MHLPKIFFYILISVFSWEILAKNEALNLLESKVQSCQEAQKRLDLQVQSCTNICSSIENKFIQERQVLENQADRQYTQLNEAFGWTVKAIGLIVSVTLGLFIFFFGRTKKEVKEAVENLLKTEVENIVTRDLLVVKERLQGLKDEVNQLLTYKDKRIVWITDLTEDIESTLRAFSNVGLVRIEVVTPTTPAELSLGDYDLVILSFDNSQRAKDILKLVSDKLNGTNGSVHLVLYTFGDGMNPVRVERPEMEILAKLKWFSMANFPTTMISQVVSLVRGSIGNIREQ